MKRLAIIFAAAAALAITPAAAASPNPGKTDKPAKSQRVKKAKPDSARARCIAERRELGVAGFVAKYGKTRTKGSARAKAKAARSSMGRCISKATKVIRAEREAEEEAEEADLEELDEEEDDCWCEVFVDDAPEEPEKPEPDDGEVVVDHEGDDSNVKSDEDDEPVVGLGDATDFDD